ncbi:patatin-like protein [Kalymmatonema gypsitolerans NIES-4073]|jgi:patatin-like phospholipase/acyl hydrolase|nr:patatin-like protein [Scytonema sp. NIES-4073]
MPFRILSLNGGGIRGVISARILAAIEKQINQPLNE